MERLQKVLARAGIASRRKSELLIQEGRVLVNGKVVRELGTQVDLTRDRVTVDGESVRLESKSYVILHKPRGFLSDRDANRGKPMAFDLVPSSERLYAAGRLDANSEGLLLLTNDGNLAHRLTHPRYGHEKEYVALVEGTPTEQDLARLKAGIWYEGERLRADSAQVIRHFGPAEKQMHLEPAPANECWLRIVLHEGKKREIRHLCGAIGHPVKRLIRIRIGPIGLGGLTVGKWRTLNEQEVRQLLEYHETSGHQVSPRKEKVDTIHNSH